MVSFLFDGGCFSMKHITSKTAADRMIAGVNAKLPKIREGIQAVDRSPGEAAADAIDKMLANLLAAFNSGKVERALRGVDLADWRERTLAAVASIPGGLEKNRSKIEAFFDELLPYQESYTRTIDAMPKTTLEDGRARMNANFDHMVDFGKRRGG